MPEANHKMIEVARHVREVTQSELSKKLQITQSNLSKIERGELRVTDTTAELIAEILRFPVRFFYQDEIKTPISSIYFRKRASIAQRSLDKIIADVKIVLKSIDYFLEDIEITEYQKYKFDLIEGWTVESVARRLRELLRVPSGAIHTPVKYLEQLGIVVYFYDCQEIKFDGLTAYTDNGVPVIFINKNLPNDRIKFTIGHEVCHLLCHIPCDLEPWRDFEAEANEFPGEFFMPTRECSTELQRLSFPTLTGLKAYWGMSKASIIYKAKRTGYISESTYKYLMIELTRRGERKNEAGYVEIDQPTIIDQVLNLLQSDLDYSDEDIADKLCIPINDFLRLFKPLDSNDPVVKIKKLRRAI